MRKLCDKYGTCWRCPSVPPQVFHVLTCQLKIADPSMSFFYALVWMGHSWISTILQSIQLKFIFDYLIVWIFSPMIKLAVIFILQSFQDGDTNYWKHRKNIQCHINSAYWYYPLLLPEKRGIALPTSGHLTVCLSLCNWLRWSSQYWTRISKFCGKMCFSAKALWWYGKLGVIDLDFQIIFISFWFWTGRNWASSSNTSQQVWAMPFTYIPCI